MLKIFPGSRQHLKVIFLLGFLDFVSAGSCILGRTDCITVDISSGVSFLDSTTSQIGV